MSKGKKGKRKSRKEVIRKEILYRGKNIDELKTLGVREATKFMPARSRRSILRNFDSVEKFLIRCEKKAEKGKKIKTHLRDLVIVPRLVGYNIEIYNGRSFDPVQITTEMIGHRLGEFALTRTRVKHGGAGIGATKSSKAQKK